MTIQLDANLLTKKELNYDENTIDRDHESFIHYSIDTSSENDHYDRAEDQDIAIRESVLESCLFSSTDEDECFAGITFYQSVINNCQLKDLQSSYIGIRKTRGGILSLNNCCVSTVNFDGSINETGRDPEHHYPLYIIDCLILDEGTVINTIRLNNHRIRHLIINSENESQTMYLYIKNYGTSKNAKIDKITIKSKSRINVLDYTDSFKNTLILKEGSGVESKIVIEKKG